MKRSLMRRMGLGMLGMACVGLAVVSSAQAQFRPVAFALNCTGSVAGPLHTRARLVGLIQVMHLASPNSQKTQNQLCGSIANPNFALYSDNFRKVLGFCAATGSTPAFPLGPRRFQGCIGAPRDL